MYFYGAYLIMSNEKKKYYAVLCGQKPGVYTKWSGENGAEVQVRGFPGARYRAFPSVREAEAWLKDPDKPQQAVETETVEKGKVIIYADGGCIDNPGPGGYGVVLLHGDKRKELSAGYRLTTNNRMELMACIKGLQTLKYSCPVILISDSRYVVDGMEKGWARRWKAKGWMRNAIQPAENADLWAQLLDLCDSHTVEFSWVKGHAGHTENERCDKLAKKAALSEENLLLDTAYEIGATTAGNPQKSLF
ncbi:MAG: ribonuclease [Acidobacteriota bacterium]|nr:ribonuclease [Acidobacteriota bacterium]